LQPNQTFAGHALLGVAGGLFCGIKVSKNRLFFTFALFNGFDRESASSVQGAFVTICLFLNLFLLVC
jgi:hypothetical protein